MTPNTIILDLPINTVPLQRARVVTSRRGRSSAYLPERSAAFVEEFGWMVKAQGILRPVGTDIALDLTFWRHHQGGHRKRGDLDNLVKAVLDAGTGILWADDYQLVDLGARFAASGPNVKGRTRVELTPVRTRVEAAS